MFRPSCGGPGGPLFSFATHALALALLAAPAAATTGARTIAPGVVQGTAAIVIDGALDDAGWTGVPASERFHQYQPQDGIPAPEPYRTRVQVAIDEGALLFAIRAWHPPGHAAAGALARRDKVARDQDYVGVWIDPAGHGRSAQFVRVNVAGVIGDGIYRADEDEEDAGPDFPVEAAVRRLPDGYAVELRWPLSSLRFPHGDARPWRLMVERSVPAAGGMLLLSAPLDKNALSFIAEMDELSQLEHILPVVQEKGFWSFRPELTSRRTSVAGRTSRSTEIGLDITARPRADWVFNATLNPDFSQVEIDEPTSAGTNRIALSLPEKRAFSWKARTCWACVCQHFIRAPSPTRPGARARRTAARLMTPRRWPAAIAPAVPCCAAAPTRRSNT